MTDPNTGIAQVCFVGDDGFLRCNFIFRKGVAIWTKSGKWWCFPVPFLRRKKKTTKTVKVEVVPVPKPAV